MKLHENDRSNLIHVLNHGKIYVNSEFKAVLLKLTVNDQSGNSSFDAQFYPI